MPDASANPELIQNEFLSQETALPWTANDYILGANSALEVISSMRRPLEDLGQKTVGLLNVGDSVMSVVKVSVHDFGHFLPDVLNILHRTFIQLQHLSSQRFLYR